MSAQTVYEQQFSSASSINDFTIFHNGEGTRDWTYSSGYLTFWDSKVAVEAWAITPGIDLEAGKTYQLSFDARNASSSSYTHNLYVYLETTNNKDEIDISTQEYLTYEKITSSSTATQNKSIKFSVPATGTYYLGFVDKGELTSLNNVNLDNIIVKEVKEAPNAVTGLTATAAENGAMSAILTWTNPATTDMGNALSEISKIEVYRGTTSYKTELAYTLTDSKYLTPGAEISFTDDTVESRGVNYYEVVVYAGEGTSPAVSVKSPWIGPDSSLKALGTVKASVNGDNNVVLDFAIPEGSNGAYVNPTDVAFKIERKLSSTYSYTVIDAAYNGALPYIDTTAEPFNIYTYRVSTIYNGSTGTAKTSNDVTVAGVATVPYKQGFDDKNAFSFFTTFNGGTGLTSKWTFYSYSIRYYNGGRYGDTSADAWTITPKISLEAGKVYRLSYDAWISTAGEANYKDLFVTIGTEPTAEAQTVLNEKNATVSNLSSATDEKTRSIIIKVTEDNDYNIGFHVYGQTSTAYIYLDNISLEEIVEVPAAVADLTVTPDAGAQLEAILAWTNPTLTNAGGELTEITKAELLRDGEVIYTKETPIAGDKETYTDNDAALTAGNHTYTVLTYIGENASEASNEATAWIGPDDLKAVENAKAELAEDGTSVTVSFDALDPATGGANGGYIGEVAYKVVRMPDEAVIAEAAEGSPVVDDTIEGLSLGAYYYEITVVRGAEESEAAATGKIVLGDAITLGNGETYSFDFSNSDFFDLWTSYQDETITRAWSYSNTNKRIESSYYKAVVFTPKFKLYEGNYELEYYACLSSGRYPSGLTVFLATNTTTSVNPDETEANALDEDVPETAVISNKTLDGAMMTKYTDEFNVGKYHTYYIGFQHNPGDGMLPQVYVQDVKLTAKNVTGVENVGTDNSGMAYDMAGEALITPEGASVEIYGIDGKLVLATVSDGRVSLSHIVHGVYVVRIGADTFKFIK